MNNVAGIMGNGGLRSFNSVDDCIGYTANMLKTKYIDQGLTSVGQIWQKYCPVGAGSDPNHLNDGWGSGVASFMQGFSSYRIELKEILKIKIEYLKVKYSALF